MGFPPFVTHLDFFKNRAMSLLYPHDALTSCKKLEKTNEWSIVDIHTDVHTDNKPGVQN